MPPKQSNEKGAKGKNKRKAKSPLVVDDQCTRNNKERVSEHSCNSVNTKSLRFDNSMNQNDCQNMNINPCLSQHVTSPVMNFTPLHYGMPSPQTPMAQYIPQPAHQQQGPPPWASEILAEIKTLKLVMPKLEQIETTVNSINVKMKELDTKVTHIETRVTDVENSCSFINDKHEKQTNELKHAQTEVKNLQSSCKDLEENMKSLKSEKDGMRTKLIDLESRSMRENLMFYGIQEVPSENCEHLVKQFCDEKLSIDASSMIFDRVHRVGGESTRKPRPIVAKFHYYNERETIRKKGLDCSTQLKTQNQGVGIQRPKAVRDARKNLYGIMKREQSLGKNARFIGDKLFINGREYVGEGSG